MDLQSLHDDNVADEVMIPGCCDQPEVPGGGGGEGQQARGELQGADQDADHQAQAGGVQGGVRREISPETPERGEIRNLLFIIFLFK